MSDGCSVPDWMVPIKAYFETPVARQVCEHHDHAYYLGGPPEWRLLVDAEWLARIVRRCVLPGEMPLKIAERGYTAIRIFGGPHWRKPWSWAFGGCVWCYSDRPAEEQLRPVATNHA